MGKFFKKYFTQNSMTLNDVMYAPHLWINSLSITNAINNPNVKMTTRNV